MKSSLLFDFIVDKTAKTVFIVREFDAGLSLVWDAFTKADMLDQWWAPKPWISKTKIMDFKVGGRRFFAMVSPEGQPGRWLIQRYTSITPKTNFKTLNFFADEAENPELPGSEWDFNFSEANARPNDPVAQGTTKVSITIYNDSLARFEKMVDLGFREGFTSGLEQLDELLLTLKDK